METQVAALAAELARLAADYLILIKAAMVLPK